MATLRQMIDSEQDKGVGDTIKRATSALGIKPCGGCQKRAEALNKRFPYKGKHGSPTPEGMMNGFHTDK
jgi:hypothetical protein